MEDRTIRASNNGRRQTEKGHMRLKVKAEFFYADYGMVGSTNPGWIQTTFDMLTGIFKQVGLNTNFNNATHARRPGYG